MSFEHLSETNQLQISCYFGPWEKSLGVSPYIILFNVNRYIDCHVFSWQHPKVNYIELQGCKSRSIGWNPAPISLSQYLQGFSTFQVGFLPSTVCVDIWMIPKAPTGFAPDRKHIPCSVHPVPHLFPWERNTCRFSSHFKPQTPDPGKVCFM